MNAERKVVAGQIVGQGALIVVTPVLTRLNEVGQIGIFQLAAAIALVLQPLATLRLEYLIPTADSVGRERALVRLGLGVTFVLSASAFLGGLCLLVANLREPAGTLIAIALVLATYGWMAVENAVLIRSESLRSLALRNALSGVLAAFAQVALSAFLPSAISLAFGLFAGRCLAIVVTRQKRIPTNSRTRAGHPIARSEIPRILRVVTSGIVSSASVHIPIFVATVFFGSVAAGQTAMAQRIAGAPTTLIGQSLGQILTARIAPMIRARQPGVRKAVTSMLAPLALASAMLSLLLMTLGPLLAEPVLGPGWDSAGTLLAIFAIPLSFQLALLPLAPVFVMLGKERSLLTLQAGRLAAMIAAACTVGLLSSDLFRTATAIAIVWTLSYALQAYVLVIAAIRYDRFA